MYLSRRSRIEFVGLNTTTSSRAAGCLCMQMPTPRFVLAVAIGCNIPPQASACVATVLSRGLVLDTVGGKLKKSGSGPAATHSERSPSCSSYRFSIMFLVQVSSWRVAPQFHSTLRSAAKAGFSVCLVPLGTADHTAQNQTKKVSLGPGHTHIQKGAHHGLL